MLKMALPVSEGRYPFLATSRLLGRRSHIRSIQLMIRKHGEEEEMKEPTKMRPGCHGSVGRTGSPRQKGRLEINSVIVKSPVMMHVLVKRKGGWRQEALVSGLNSSKLISRSSRFGHPGRGQKIPGSLQAQGLRVAISCFNRCETFEGYQ